MKKLLKFAVSLILLMWVNVHHLSAGTSEKAEKMYVNTVKMTFLSWFTGSTKISYERAFPKIHQSGEFTTSLIGAGYDKYKNNPLGFTLRYGHKFFIADNRKSPLRGLYLRPEFIYSRYRYDSQSLGEKTIANMNAAIATLGYQFVYKRFLADAWFGGGYAFGTPCETLYHHGFDLWHFWGEVNESVAMSFSIKLGFCF